jgi:hypothetical protein
VDEIGFFTVDPKPDGSFRLRCRTPDGADVMTDGSICEQSAP